MFATHQRVPAIMYAWYDWPMHFWRDVYMKFGFIHGSNALARTLLLEPARQPWRTWTVQILVGSGCAARTCSVAIGLVGFSVGKNSR